METTTKTDFSATILVHKSPDEVFDAIANVGSWWTKSFTGSAKEPGDTFSVTFGETSVDFKITDAVPGKQVTWLVTDCHLHWLTDKKEWKGTKVAWEIIPAGDTTEIAMTHIGLVPEAECFESCEKGWNFFVRKSLYKLLTENQGLPDQPVASRDL